MAEFIGTKKEFNRFLGPHLRNLVQHLTRKYRREIGKCEHCGTENNLESAHVNGKERIEIIDKILIDFYSVNNYRVNIIDFESRFKKEHENLHEVILILCKDCHSTYDSKSLPRNSEQKRKVMKTLSPNRIYTNTEIQKKLSSKLKEFEQLDLEKFCNEDYCNRIFKINSPLLIKIPKNTPMERKKEVVRDNNVNRWTWKYEFSKGDFIYAISTQWYDKNDLFVKEWLEIN